MINILDIHIANIIAAGEVVDRPSSALKELLENSIDAGSTVITVEIKEGGSGFMRVTDNGCGMSLEDLSKCILRHATSKIRQAEDIEMLVTLGFRGEALAAISAVSEMKIFTREKNTPTGYLMEVKNGSIMTTTEAGCAVGTTIIIEKMFYNLPARRKFLKSNTAEATSCKWAVEKIALSNPHVSLRLLVDNKEKLFTPGTGDLYKTIYAVLGKATAETLISVENYTLNDITISGYISKIEHGKANRAEQSFFVNGRYVRSKTAVTALENAYKSIAQTSDFPVCVIYIRVKEDKVDVNIHPQKLEVKFSDERQVYETVYYAIRNTLNSSSHTGVKDESAESVISVPDVKKDSLLRNVDSASSSPDKLTAPEFMAVQPSFERFQSPSTKGRDTEEIRLDIQFDPNDYETEEKEQIHADSPTAERQRTLTGYGTGEDTSSFGLNKNGIYTGGDYKIIGEAFFGYIIVQTGEKLLFIDKHAAHERILYDELVKSAMKEKNPVMQILIEPLVKRFGDADFAVLNEYREQFAKIGIKYGISGDNEVTIAELPDEFTGTDIFYILEYITGTIREEPFLNAKDILGKIITLASVKTTACRRAMKMGNYDDRQHTEWLCGKIMSNNVKYCPHGRPFFMEMKKSDMDRYFRRT